MISTGTVQEFGEAGGSSAPRGEVTLGWTMNGRFVTHLRQSRLFMLLRCGSFLSLIIVLEAATEPATPSPPETRAVEALVGETMQRNPELAFYRAEIAAAKAGRKTAGTMAYPELNTHVGYKGVDDLRSHLLGEGVAWQVSVQQPIEWPGRLALRKAIANRDVELAELGLEQFQTLLAARTRGLAHRLFVAQERAAAAREVAARFQALQEILLQRDQAGLTPLLETRIMEANALILHHQAREADIAVQTALLALNQLRGQPPQTTLRVTPADLQFLPPSPLENLLSTARLNNFEIRIKQAELAQQGLAVSLARHERSPAVAVGPYVSQERAADKETQVGVSISLPLPFWQQPANNVNVAQARQEQGEAALQVTVRRIEQEVAQQALTYEARLAEMQHWPKDALPRFREAAELADRHYRLGAVPVATYVELQKQYLQALDAVWTTRQQALEAAEQLQLLTGSTETLVKVAEPEPSP
jgi:cobalt-zinc-cadmium efflux system outer membrane protein